MSTLADITLADLERAQRLAARVGDEIDPQVRCATPNGDYWIAITLPGEVELRATVLSLLSDWMAVNQVYAFTMAAEIAMPTAMVCTGVSFSETVCAISQILNRSPFEFGPPAWLTRDEIGDEVPALLPRGTRSLDDDRIAAVQRVFGPGGVFEAVRV